MKKRALKIFLFAAVLVLVAPIFVFATNGTDKYGIERAADTAGLQRSIGGETTVPGVIGSVISAGLALLGVLFFLLILYSGFIWMKAMGKSDEVTKAKDTMEAAVVGLVLVLAAYALANFVFGSLTESTTSEETQLPACNGTCVETITECESNSSEDYFYAGIEGRDCPVETSVCCLRTPSE